jgi:glycosyltransferase involved in cell wall biosynthesis
MTQGGLRIAIIGSRGIPAGYGGFETFAQELAPRLVERHHQVTVYCRKGYTGDAQLATYRGVSLRHTPALRSRSLEQLTHEFTSILDSIPRGFQLYYFLGYRGAPFYLPIRASRRIAVVNTDGLEWKRRKWNGLGRAYLHAAEWIAAHLAADELVADARAIADYFRIAHGVESMYLTSGAYALDNSAIRPEVLEKHGLVPDAYYLVACRIEPENNVERIVREFLASGSKRTLVIVGGMNYETQYWRELQAIPAGGRVRFLGFVYGEMQIESLHLGAYAYIHGHEVGGTNPSLLTAMGAANTPIALDTPFNRENLAETGRYWTKEHGSLAAQIRWAEENGDELSSLGRHARERIRTRYTWEQVAAAHDAFFRDVARRSGVDVDPAPAPTNFGA